MPEKKMVIGSSLLNRLNGMPWVIRPEVLQTYENIFNTKFLEGEKIQKILESIETNFGSLHNDIQYIASEDNYLVTNIINSSGLNKVLIDIDGAMVKKAGWLDACCGLVGMDLIINGIETAIEDNASQLILNWGCPGGTVDGIINLTDAIRKATEYMRVTSYISGEMCSGAIFAGTAADEIFASSELDLIGSIGVIMTHIDQSKYDENLGTKWTYITAGKHKADGNAHEPLSDQSRSTLQRKVNNTYDVFISTVMKNRNMTKEEVLAIADGQVFCVKEILDTKLIDGIKTLDKIIEE